MSFQFSNLIINQIVAHVIYERTVDKQVVQPKYSDEFTVLDPAGIGTLQERIVTALGNNSHSVQMDIVKDDENSVFRLCCDLLDCNNDKFIAYTKQIADHLAQAQTSRNIPGGILVIFTGTVGADNNNFTGVIKAEVHNGFIKVENEHAIDLRYLPDLLLTPHQKLYKIGFFIEKEKGKKSPPSCAQDFLAYVYDHNMTYTETQQAALYFYEQFLGCSISATAKKMTRDFYNLTKDFINASDLTDEIKYDLNHGLYTYLKVSQDNVIRPRAFAEQFMPRDMRDGYLDHLRDNKFPNRTINKDISLLKNRLRIRRLWFSSDVKIVGPADKFKEYVTIEKSTKDSTVVRIKGKLNKQD
jgi:hypothetical protein